MREKPADQSQPAGREKEGQRPVRPPYEPPRILSREKLEAVAGACNKADPTCTFTGVVSS